MGYTNTTSDKNTTLAPATASQAYDKGFFGHPRGLATLFFTELWERFSYYGMRALLILFMTAPVAAGGLEFDVAKAGAIYGLYTAMVYMTGLPGGWIADRLLGQRRAVLIGGIIIALGNFSLAVHGLPFFFLGLVLIVTGTGLLKPNVSTMVGALYSEGDARRDAGFSIFYMGINLGAMLAPLICGYLGQRIDWHLGFAAPGIGMTIGLIQYLLGSKHLGRAGLHTTSAEGPHLQPGQKRKWIGGLASGAVVIALIVALRLAGVIHITVGSLTNAVGGALLVLPLLYFAWLFLRGHWQPVERKRLAVVAILFLFSALFWAGFEQAGSTLNLFADRFTRTSIVGFNFPSSWFQSLNAVFIILWAPVFAWLWVRLGKREPSSPAKFAYGLFFVGLGFLVLAVAALLSGPAGVRVSPLWLVVVYLIHTFGELCLSPVGLSTVTKLAPARVASQMMGIWFLSLSLGNFVGGQLAGLFESLALPKLFGAVFATTAGSGLILALLVKPIRKLMGGVH